MKRIINIDKEYTRFHGQKAIDKFFNQHPECEEWKETFEWMLESNTEHFIDDRFADGKYNADWSYSLWFEDDDNCTYIAVIVRA